MACVDVRAGSAKGLALGLPAICQRADTVAKGLVASQRCSACVRAASLEDETSVVNAGSFPETAFDVTLVQPRSAAEFP